jgi:hypothetical protein
MIEIQGQMFYGLDYHILDGCAFDDTKQCPQHLNTCTRKLGHAPLLF